MRCQHKPQPDGDSDTKTKTCSPSYPRILATLGMSFAYQNVSAELDSIDGVGEDDDQPTGGPQPDAQREGRLKLPQHRSHKILHKPQGTKELTSIKTSTGSQDCHKHTWAWIAHCLENKPYQLKDSWTNTSWHLAKRLFTASVLIRSVLAPLKIHSV